MKNNVLMGNCVLSLEPHTFVSVLKGKQEKSVRKQVGTTFKFVAEKKPLPLHLIHFAIFPTTLSKLFCVFQNSTFLDKLMIFLCKFW